VIRQASHGLTLLGIASPPSASRALNHAKNQLETGRRMRSHGLKIPSPLTDRFDVFYPAATVANKAQRPLYVEFGVHRGYTMSWWTHSVTVSEARFVGFDSFEGLPETWTPDIRKGTFSTNGQAPETDDERVSFIKGWFADTVPNFAPPDHDLLIVNVDGDLYSSATCCLGWAARNLRVGDFLYFDEFRDSRNEGQAFEEFAEATGFRFEVVAASHGVEHLLLRRTA
jgi:hypothetical protein